MVEHTGQPKDAWQVVIRPTVNDRLDVRVGGIFHDGNGGYEGAKSRLAEALSVEGENAYEGTILGPGSGLYRQS